MKQAWTRKKILLFLGLAWVVQGLGMATEAWAHDGRAGARGHRSAPGFQARATAHRPARRSAARPARQPRSIVPPGGLGSAANARPGFYQRLSAPLVHHGGAGIVPVPVYVYSEPLIYTEPIPISPREIPASAPQPIYIVTPPAAVPAPVPQTPPYQAAPAPVAEPAPAPKPRSTEPGEVQFSVLPTDAKIYLDDDYLGTGAELAALEDAQPFAPGVHVLEVTHPDYRPQRVVFGVSSNDATHVLVDLAVDRVGRRSRIK